MFEERNREATLEEVRAGLERHPKELSPKYFYDQRGSELFEQITRLPEYYLTRVERILLERHVPRWMAELEPRSLVELGAGNAEKTRVILDVLAARAADATYVPVDVSAAFLAETADALRAEYPRLRVIPAVADISEELVLPEALPHPLLFAFLGSTLGNFERRSAVRLLADTRQAMTPADHLLLGADLRKDAAVLEAAYNDAAGVTAEFNRNLLRVLNRALGADFVPEQFDHRAVYDRDEHRIEMHLVSTIDQRVRIPGIGAVEFRAGEPIRTEISNKYDRESLADLLRGGGLQIREWVTDPEERFALVLAAPAS